MKSCWKRPVAWLLALALAGSTALPVLADEPAQEEVSAQPLSVTVGTYTPRMAGYENIQAGETYTLIALSSDLASQIGDRDVSTLGPDELLAASDQALFLGSAIAQGNGQVTFEDVRLRTADAVVYYVTGPGLDAPLYEVTNANTNATGRVLTDTQGDHSATVTLLDAQTGYRYGNSVQADADGSYAFPSLAPGSYYLQVTKPGYLPTTPTAVDIPDGKTTILQLFNLSSDPYIPTGQSPVAGLNRVGDVNNDGARDMDDLAALLVYYGRADAVPADLTADLSGDGQVDKADTDLLIHAAAKPDVPDLTTGTDEAVTGASITVADGGGDAASDLRYLSFSLDTTSTVSAAAFSLTFPADTVRPLNAKGGLIAPVDGSTTANCLVSADGFTARRVLWRVEGDQVTLTFAVTADTPQAAGEVARFYYRPVSGSTASFYDGVFTLSHAAALVGRDTVVTDAALSYPGRDGAALTAIAIDPPSAATLTIPATGRTAVLALSATGRDASGTSYTDLSGVIWTAVDENGLPPAGVTVSQGLLTVTSDAAPGTIYLTAARGEVVSDPLAVTLEETPRTAYALTAQKDGVTLDADELTFAAGEPGEQTYTALVLDQYGVELAPQPEVTWSLSGAPAGIALSGGVLTSDGTTPAGVYSFHLLAQAEGLQAAVSVTLTLEPELAQLSLAGARRAVIPAEGAAVLSLTYTVTAVDKQGSPMSLGDREPTFTVSPADQGVSAARDPVSGEYTVTVSDAAQAGSYTLTAQLGDISGTLELALEAPAQQTAVRAALFYDGEPLSAARFSLYAGFDQTFSFTARLLDADGDTVAAQPSAWRWSLSGDAPGGVSIPASGELGVLSASGLAAGSYVFDLTATDPESGLAVSLPVTLTVAPVVSSLRLTAPDRLVIPAGEDLTYLLSLTAQDVNGQAIALSEGLVWSVTAKGSAQAPAGVSVADGVLTVTSAAVPGDIIVTAAYGSSVSASQVITLDPAGAETSALVLYRQVSVDGEVVLENAPVSALDEVNIKEGQRAVFTYTAFLVNQTTGEATAVPAAQVKWLGAADGTFTVDENAESGVYPLNVTAVSGGQSASASAKATLYPNITGLLLDFGDGATEPPYELSVPSKGSNYYSATLIAQVKRAGATLNVPVRDLGLEEYDVELATALTGLYATLDKTAGTLEFTVDATAVQNPTQAPSDGSTDIRFVQLLMDYFPGETFSSQRLPLYLTPAQATVTSAILRRGTGSGTAFSFGTPKDGEVTTAEAGTLSNCYAMELLDQYGSPVTDATVEWTLTVPDELMDGSTMLVSLAEPGSAIESAYPGYASIRRLRVSADAPAGGPYRLTLVAKAADKTCSIPILLTVEPQPDVSSLTMTVSGAAAITIPMYYAQYNATTLNDSVNSATFTAILRTASGGELDPGSRYTFAWAVTDANGNTPAGVSVSPVAGTASATVRVDRAAQPTGSADSGKLRLTATLTDGQSASTTTDTALVELNRSTSVPTLMSIRRNGAALTSESYTLAATDTSTVTRDYTFRLLDQYNQEAAQKDQTQVSWTLTNSASSGVTLTTLKDDDGVAYARLTVKHPGYAVNKTVTLTASITIADSNVSTGRVTIKCDLPIAVKISSSSSSSGGGSISGGGGGGSLADGVPSTVSISGNSYLNTTYGTAASQTYSCTLRDASGATCAISYQSAVSWSASGLTGGISFNTATHVLSVPATTAAGVYKVILTARYNASVTGSVTVTVNVSNPSGGTPTSIAISGSSTVAATQGTALSKTWSATLKDASGNVTTVGQGSVIWALSTLSNGAVSVTFDANTATLTVPATSGTGTLSTTLTAKYGTLTATLPLTVTVSAAQSSSTAGAGPTIVPTVTQSGTTGTVTLTTVQEKAITDAATTGATVTIAPTGTSGLASLSVSLTAATVKTMANQHSQTLKVQTALGTVLLPAQTLAALAEQGGSEVTVTLTSSGGAVGVTFTCGYESSSLPGAIVLSVPTTGNVAVRVDGSGGKQVVKKAVVKNGNILTYLSGSTQLQLENRAPAFTDTQNHWAKDAIVFTSARELFQGTSDATFSPDATMTRSMLVTVLHRLEDTPAVSASSTFDDVAAGTWYTDAVSWANGKGIVQGTDDGFKPGDPVTREQLATILYRYVGSLGLSTGQTGSLSSFSDQGKVSSWAKTAMQWAVGAGLINGKTGGLLDPTGNATRAEVSTILQRLVTNVLAPSV